MKLQFYPYQLNSFYIRKYNTSKNQTINAEKGSPLKKEPTKADE